MTDLVVTRGDTLVFNFGPMQKRDGSILDISGYTVNLTAKDRLDDPDNLAVFGATATIVNGTTGEGSVSVPPSATSGFTTERVLHWDLQLTDPGGGKLTVDSGKLRVQRDVTRA